MRTYSRRPVRLLAGILLALFVLLLASTSAMATWLTESTTNLSEGYDAEESQVAVDAQGNTTVVWVAAYSSEHVIKAAYRPAGGTWQKAESLSEPHPSAGWPHVALDSHGNVTVIWASNTASTWSVEAAYRPAGGAWQKAERLPAKSQGVEPQIAVDSQGDATAVWDRAPGTHENIETAYRPAGGAWQEAESLSEPGKTAENPEVAVDPQGDTTAAWQSSKGFVQDVYRPAGGTWQVPQNLSAAGQNAGKPQIAVDPQGDTTVVWERSDSKNYIVQGAYRPAGGAWQEPQNLSATGQNAEEPRVAADAQGNAMAVWERSDGKNSIVQGAYRPAGGAWQEPQNLSAAGQSAREPRVAVGEQGNTTVVWERFDGENWIVQGAYRPAGGAWQESQNLSVAGQDAREPRVAADAQGNAAAVWERFDGKNHIVQAVGDEVSGPQLNGLSIPGTAIAGVDAGFSVSPLSAWSTVAGTIWQFGDGSTAAGTSVVHAYAAAGTFTVTVTSSDALAHESSTTSQIVVSAAAATKTGPPPAPVAPSARVAAKSVKVTNGSANVVLSCLGGSPGTRCTGTLTLQLTLKGTTHKRVHGRLRRVKSTRTLNLGARTYSLANGSTTSIQVKLSSTALKRLSQAHSHRLSATAQLVSPPQKPTRATVVLSAQAHKKPKGKH